MVLGGLGSQREPCLPQDILGLCTSCRTSPPIRCMFFLAFVVSHYISVNNPFWVIWVAVGHIGVLKQ